MRYQDLPQFTRGASYSVDVSWKYLPQHYYSAVVDDFLDVNPNFQRGHVWTDLQKVRYVEYILQGGRSGKDLYFNCPNWHSGHIGPEHPGGWYVMVDGKQRVDAVLGYLSNEFQVFGKYFHRDFTDSLDVMVATFKWHVNELPTIEEVYDWYIGLNTGGTVHSEEEIARVRGLIAAKVPYIPPVGPEVLERAHLNRTVMVAVKTEHEAEKASLAERAAAPIPVKKASRRKR